MPEIYKVNINVTTDLETLLKIPDTIRVSLGTIVQFKLVADEYILQKPPWASNSLSRGWLFKIYFENGSPFDWKTESFSLFSHGFGRQFRTTIAEGETKETGTFKYGVRAVSVSIDDESSEPIYDEDPFLIVY